MRERQGAMARSGGQRLTAAIAATVALACGGVLAQSAGWYTQGDFAPTRRLVFELTNDLDLDRVAVPVVLARAQLPVTDLHELEVTVVDPALPPAPPPGAERLKRGGGHELLGEANGHILPQQMDDLDKDGVWDELFFVTDIKARQKKRIDIYLGMNQRGWNPHETHAGIGSYVRHLVPFWESKNIGWKLWFPTSVDVYGKRKPMLMANRLYMENLDGYAVSLEDPALGSDIQSVEDSFGGGGICLFESPGDPTAVSVPRFTPARSAAGVKANFNAGQVTDTRYAYDVVVNGPVRSMVRVKTMNWKSGKGTLRNRADLHRLREPELLDLPGETGAIPAGGAGRRARRGDPQEAARESLLPAGRRRDHGRSRGDHRPRCRDDHLGHRLDLERAGGQARVPAASTGSCRR